MALALAESLLEKDIESCLVTDAGSYAADLGREKGVQVEEVPFFSLTGVLGALRSSLDRLQPDLIHAHGSRAGFHVGRWSRHHPETPTHYTVHGYHFHHRRGLRRLAGRWAERRTGRRLRSVIHVCDYDRRLAETWGLVADTAPRRVIYNGVDPEALPLAEPAEPPRVVFVGRLVPQKDPLLIAAIAARLAGTGVAVTIVGGGEKEGEVKSLLAREMADGRVEVTGAVDRRRALAELAAASVLVLPSQWEGLPITLLEALALGVPVVAAAVGGVPEIVDEGVGGILIGGRDPQSYSDAVGKLLGDRALRRRLGDAGRERIAERFTLARCLEQYRALYSR
jgi:glycosyltransferase involved in cell wall biosynthesis